MRLTKKKKLKKTIDDVLIPIDINAKKVCYICNKIVKDNQRFYAIGKDKNGIELYRHLKCKTRGIK